MAKWHRCCQAVRGPGLSGAVIAGYASKRLIRWVVRFSHGMSREYEYGIWTCEHKYQEEEVEEVEEAEKADVLQYDRQSHDE
jgi:hypothetical protein